MALDLTGISNENEFYTSHYLAAILEDDLKDLFSTWTKAAEEGKGKPPADRLLALSRDYARLRSEIARERDPEERLALQRPFLSAFLSALGYDVAPAGREVADGAAAIPVLAEVKKRNGAPEIWVLETVETDEEDAAASDPLSLPFLPAQLPPPEPVVRGSIESNIEALPLPADGGEPLPLEDVLTDLVFSLPEPPRWAVVLNHGLVVLADRTKWGQKRTLRFDLAELYGRRVESSFRALAALLHRDSLAPEGGLSLLDTLDESSHKHAFAVSDDLKYSVREAVELLGNEALYDLRERLREGVYGREMAKPLTDECLRYLYRLLFCFYVEARPELGYAPMKSEEYRTGYSLEALRDLELHDLTTEESKNGFFLNDSIRTLFRLVSEGFRHEEKQTVLGADEGAVDRHTFRMEPLRSHLFDPARTPILERVRFRNHVLQKVLECLSLSRPKRGGKGGKKKRGRISYAQLGINQLGAVYEGLLSYTGFFAEEDLYEVHRAGETPDELQNAWFVRAADLPKYTDDEKLFDGRPKKYAKGTFIYRLAGRNREKSASYYTPEVLTRCVVKYALKELLKDRPADDILSLTICEPALGSGAFANEAVNQLAEGYLERKQAELKRSIPHDELLLEKQKVKAYLADNNVHGVDLNPTAVELAEISLWLNTIYAGHTIPWFGNQLVAGNSLVGARRQVFTPKAAPKKKGHWSFEGVPDRVKLGETRPEGAVWHFLAPDDGMCAYDDKVVRELAPAEIKAIKEWKKEFGQPFSESELKTLRRLSAAIDRLWAKHVEERRMLRAETRNLFPVFGHEDDPAFAPPAREKRLSTGDKDRLYRQRFLAEGVRASSPYRRLKTAMDYWCALWFWPIEKADLLPTREQLLFDLALLLEGTSQGVALVGGADQTTLFPDDTPRQEALKLVDEFGFVDVDKLTREVPRLATVKELAEKHRFLHWELEFAEVFADRGGFDLIVGNPPWIKVEWNGTDVLVEADPLLALRSMSVPEITAEGIGRLQASPPLSTAFLDDYVEATAMTAVLGAPCLHPRVSSTQANLYKSFLSVSWDVVALSGIVGLLHEEGFLDDPRGTTFTCAALQRCRYLFRFRNEWGLFPEVYHHKRFAAGIYGEVYQNPAFSMLSNIFHPKTIDMSFESSDLSPEGIKDRAGNWNLSGSASRIVRIEGPEVELFARLYGQGTEGTRSVRIPALQLREQVSTLRLLTESSQQLGARSSEWSGATFPDETRLIRESLLRKGRHEPQEPSDWILSGSQLWVANSRAKAVTAGRDGKWKYTTVDLQAIPAKYLPPAIYRYSITRPPLLSRHALPWGPATSHTDSFRLAFRSNLNPEMERTVVAALVPPGPAHTDTIYSVAFRDPSTLAFVAGVAASLPIDFFVRATGRPRLRRELVALLPVPRGSVFADEIRSRALLLNCISQEFEPLWTLCWHESWREILSAYRIPEGSEVDERVFGPTLSRNTPLRADRERRRALVELDVLVAMALGMTFGELLSIYRIQFPVLQQNERETWYDSMGRIVFTTSDGLRGIGIDRSLWNEIRDMKSGTVSRAVVDETLPGGPRERTITYVAPFDRCDREADYRLAWRAFEGRLKGRTS